MTKDPPYGAKIEVTGKFAMGGWNAPENEPYLNEYVNNASMKYFGKESLGYGMGGSIPLMGLLLKLFPKS